MTAHASEPSPVVAKALPAATMVVARACPEDTFEVYLVKRHGRSGFMAGAHVFPGGRVDDDDSGFDNDRFAVCAIRETWEETGMLLAKPESGLPLTTDGPLMAFDARMVTGEPFNIGLMAAGLLPDVDSLVDIGWWLTPEAEPRRFDTRFFFGVVPPPQRHRADPDGLEVTEGEWFTPQAALDAARDGRIKLAPPTLVTLEELAPLKLSQVKDHAWPKKVVCPLITEENGKVVLALPGDPLHAVKEAVWPHRTRVVAAEEGRFVSAKV